MMFSATLSELISRLHDGVRLVLPSTRAAGELRAAFDAEQIRRGHVAWEPPQVLSWAQWTSSLWNELVVEGAERRLLLNTAQEHSLWCEVLKEGGEIAWLSSVESLAELAMSAWKLTAGYNAMQKLRAFAVTHESRVFTRWAEEFSKRCSEREYLSSALLEEALRRHVVTGSLTVPASLELVGFGERLPVQDALLHELRERGTIVAETTLQKDDDHLQSPQKIIAANEQAELGLAAVWIRKHLKAAQEEGRRARVALLVPNLQEERSAVEVRLREILAPELQWIGADLSSAPWEISGGVPLTSVAMIADALALVRWTEEPLSIARASSLLISPYVGQNGDDSDVLNASARFDAGRLRHQLLLRPEIGLESLVHMAGAFTQQQSTGMAENDALEWLLNILRSSKDMQDRTRMRSFAEWMEFVRRLLRAANWPGTRLLNATEFETTRAWESVLDLVSTLDFAGHRVSFSDALRVLDAQAKKTIFVPARTNAPVQVMSVAEGEGCVFDAAVFLRCTDANWPRAERTNPLLSWALQRTYKMPGTDAGRSSARSREFTESLIHRSGQLLFSCAAEDGRGKLRPSPLLDELKIAQADAQGIAGMPDAAESLKMEEYIDNDPLPALSQRAIQGGSAVLKLQAACGFLAFAQIRLHSKEPESCDLGLNAMESGDLLHRTMQFFWKTVRSQDVLRQMSFAERKAALMAAIEGALAGKIQIRNGWDKAYVALQKERLSMVLQGWLEEELRRSPFFVLDTEQKQSLAVGPLILDVRIDRVDCVDKGIVLVDYKTGYAVSVKQWESSRPDDPQLPLYTLIPDAGELKGVAFAKIRAGSGMQWLGYQAEEGVLPHAKVRDLTALSATWRETLTRLAEDFAEGKADVKPKDYTINCVHCAQRLLCRVDRNALQTDAQSELNDTEFVDG